MKTLQTKPAAAKAISHGSFFGKSAGTDLSAGTETATPFFNGPELQARSATTQPQGREQSESGTESSDIPVQAKLTVGAPGDLYEKEADAVADKVVQRLALSEAPAENAPSIQAQPVVSGITPVVQAKCSACEQEEQQKEDEPQTDPAPGLQKKAAGNSMPEPPPQDNDGGNATPGTVQRKCSACAREEQQVQRSSIPNASRVPQVQRSCRECEEGDRLFLKPVPGIQRAQESAPSANGSRDSIIAFARSQLGKVEAKHNDGSGKRVGARYLLEYFHTAAPGVWPDQIIETAGAKMPSWCGIFSVWAHKKAGKDIGNWQMGRGVSAFGKLTPTTSPQPGDIGYIHKPYQHHCIVVKVEGGSVHSIDGNSGMYSEVKENIRPLSEFTGFFTAFGAGSSGSVQRKEAEEETIQKKENNNGGSVAASLESRLAASGGSGSSLPDPVRSDMGQAIGADFSNVRIHTGSEAVQMSKELNAQAFTHGNDIYFNEGKYDTASKSGQHLLAHELTHTVQQNAAGVQKKAVPDVQRTPATEEQKEAIRAALARLGVRVDDPDTEALHELFPDGINPRREVAFVQVSGENYSSIARISSVRLGAAVAVTPGAEIYVFEVGKGRAILLSSIGGGSVMLDAGAGGAVRSNSTAARTLATHVNNLVSSGLAAAPSMIKISHVDADHYNALSSVLNLPQMGTAVVELTRQQLTEATTTGTWRTMNVVIAPTQSIVQINISGTTGVDVQRSIIGNMELTEFRSNAAHTALTAPGARNYNKNNTSTVTVMRDLLNNSTYVFTGDAEGRLLNEVVNSVGEDAMRRILGGGARNLAAVEFPHHGGAVNSGPDVAGMTRFLRLLFESSNGTVNFFAQTNTNFSGTDSASIRYLDTAQIPVERVMNDPAGATGVRRMRGGVNERITLNGNMIASIVAMGNANSSAVMEAYQLRDRLLTTTSTLLSMEATFRMVPGDGERLSGALGAARGNVDTHQSNLNTRLAAFWTELATAAQGTGMRASTGTAQLTVEVNNLQTNVRSVNIEAIENSILQIRNGISIMGRIFLNSLSMQQALRERNLGNMNALKGEQRQLISELLGSARAELGRTEYHAQIRAAWESTRSGWDARYVQRVARRMGITEAQSRNMLFRTRLSVNLARQMQLNDLSRRAHEGMLPPGAGRTRGTRAVAGVMAAIELLRIGLEFYDSWEAAEVASELRDRQLRIQGMRELYWWIDMGVRPEIRLIGTTFWGNRETLDIDSEQAYRIINEEVPEDQRPEYQRVVVYNVSEQDLQTVVAQFNLRFLTLSDWVEEMGAPDLNNNRALNYSHRWIIKEDGKWYVRLYSTEDEEYRLTHIPSLEPALEELMVHLNANQEDEFERLRAEHASEGTFTAEDTALIFGTDREVYVYNNAGGIEEYDFDGFSPTFVRVGTEDYPPRYRGSLVKVRAADAETYRRLSRYHWVWYTGQTYISANGGGYETAISLNHNGYAYIDADDLEQKDEPTVQPKAEDAASPAESPDLQLKCAACEQEEENEGDVSIQRAPETGDAGPAPVSTPPSAAQSEGVTGAPAATHFITEESAVPEAGQMRKSEFLDRLKAEICASVNDALAGSPFSADSCPYIQSAFSTHRNSAPERIEALIIRYAPEARGLQTAIQVIDVLKAKAYAKAREWLLQGATAGAAMQMLGGFADGVGSLASTIGTGVSNAVNSMSSGVSNIASGIGSLLFKENTGGATATRSPQAVMDSLGTGQNISGGTRSKMEGAFGSSFSDVQIHTDSSAAQLSQEMNARAFTVGNHIAFASGEHQPGTIEGDALLAHELAHTLQQKDGEASGAQMKGAEYNELETDADNMAVNVMMKLNGGKGEKVQNKVKKGLNISRCSGCGSSSPTPAPTPAPTLTPEFMVTGLPLNTAAFRTKIFFDRNSTTIAASEEAKLTAIGSGSTTTEADLHGYASEDETTAGLETTRITEVDRMLGTKGHTAPRHPLPHPGAGAGIIDYRQMRAVEIRRTGETPNTPNCIDPITGTRRNGYLACSPAAQFTTAQTLAGQMLTRAINALNVGAITPVATAGLTRFFGANPGSLASVAATVRGNLTLLQSHIAVQMAANSTIPTTPGGSPGPGHLCGDECETGCSGGTIAYNSGRDAAATMVLCKPFMDDTNPTSRAETLIHEGLHGITLSGVTARGGIPTNASDFTYDWQRLINFLDTPTALRNNDSYMLFVRQIMNPTVTIEGGQPPGDRDTITGVAAGSAEENDIKAVIGYMESWFEKANQDLESLHGTIVDSIPAGRWTNGYYRNIMRITAPHFGLTIPPTTPTEVDKFKVAGISNRMSRIRNVFSLQLSISRASTPISVWSPGPGATVTLGDDFFAAGSRRAKLDLLIGKIIEANTEIAVAHRSHFSTLVDELRTNGERGTP